MRNLLYGVLLAFALSCSAFPCAAEESRTVVILDATAQMSANLGQKRKLDWVKSGLGAAVDRMDQGSSFGLWAFGANPQKKCDAMSELVPLQPASAAAGALNKALAALQPKAARAPAMGAIEAALKSAASPDGKAVSAILIAGTGDDCIADICATAGRLHDLYPNGKLTVFGIGMSDETATKFTCAAKAMGGSFTAIKSGADLERNLRQTLGGTQTPPQPKSGLATAPPIAANGMTEANEPEKQAYAAASASPLSAQPAQKEPEEKIVLPPQPEPNVVLSAVLTSGAPPLEAGVTWEIYKIQVTPTQQLRMAEAPLWVGGGGQARAKLPEGLYAVKLAYGLAAASSEFTLGAEKVEKTIVMDAGTIAAEALQTPAGPPASDVFFVLYKQKTSAAREELGRSSEKPALFHLNAGDYALVAFAGPAMFDTTVKVVPGKVSAVQIALNVGTLEIKTFAKENSPELVAAWHQIFPAASDQKKGSAPLARFSASSQRLQLPAGSYRLETIYGNAREEKAVSVTAGQTTPVTVILNAGEAKVSLPSGGTGKVCAVYEAGADRKAEPVGRAAGADMRFILKAGRYDLECRGKGEDAPAKQTEITIVAGEVSSARFEN
jgi:hypothetical protein